jgi:GNAT superfamily N-acetyltransferase
LAVSRNHQRKGIGAPLLARALRIAYENASIVGSSVIVVGAIDDSAVEFYKSHGFVRLGDGLRLITPMSVVGKLVGE